MTFFETIKIENGKAVNLEYHQRRYEKTLLDLGRAKPQNLVDLIATPQDGLYRCRFVYDLVGGYEVEFLSYKKRDIKKLKLVEADLAYSYKSSDREALDELFAKREECDDLLFVQGGLVSDTTIANVAFFDGSVWLSPKKPLLEGTTRARLLDEKKIHLADIEANDLKRFKKIALLNAMIGFDILQKSVEEIVC
ncbi:MAG: aminotransferase class IV family protein [Sulfuricurvum sp.]